MILVVEKTKLPVFLITNHMTYVIEGSVWMLTSCSAPWWMCCGSCGLYCTFFWSTTVYFIEMLSACGEVLAPPTRTLFSVLVSALVTA